MFDFVTKHKRWLQGALLVLIVPPFALFGIEYYFQNSGTGGAVATVGKARISEFEYGQSLRQAQERMREMMQNNADPAILNSPQFRESVLNEMVDRSVLVSHARQAGLAVSTPDLQKVITQLEAFHDETGKFSMDRYRTLLRNQGLSEAIFEDDLRTGVMLGQLQGVYAGSGFVPDSVVERLVRIREQEREVSQVVFNPADYLKQASVTPADAEKYYNDHKAEFQIPERVKIEYALLTLDAAEAAVQVSDEELRAVYDQGKEARFSTPEERHASHILITAPATASAEDKAKAKAKAEDLLKQVKAAPAKFAELARTHSQDPGSAEKGGDLGSFGRGLMVKPFDDALFAMKPGEIAGPVETQYGYHIIRLDGVKGGQVTPFEKVKSQIADEVRKAKAGKAFSEAAEKFNDMVYEQYDSLKPAADAFKLTIQKTDWVSRAGGNANPLLNNEKLLAALFSDEVLKNKHNTSAIEVQANTMLAARVTDHQPAAPLPFAEVRADIQNHLAAEAATRRAEAEGRAALESLQKGGAPKVTAWSAPQMVSLQKRQGLHAEASRAVFSADAAKLPAYVGVPAPQGRFVIYRISRVKDLASVDPAQKKALARQLAQMAGQEQFQAYLASLRSRTDVKIDRKKLEQGGS
ncbi:MAG TPA: SurA N-terminal domain-containing protein [Burkholderiales bacterium]|nr:SurA N-terminal domain-containing protein [Burkholderiales bacterium]